MIICIYINFFFIENHTQRILFISESENLCSYGKHWAIIKAQWIKNEREEKSCLQFDRLIVSAPAAVKQFSIISMKSSTFINNKKSYVYTSLLLNCTLNCTLVNIIMIFSSLSISDWLLSVSFHVPIQINIQFRMSQSAVMISLPRIYVVSSTQMISIRHVLQLNKRSRFRM